LIDQNPLSVAHDSTVGGTITFTIGNPLALCATNLIPSNGTTITTAGSTTLSWTAGQYATCHTVRFGTTTPPPVVATCQAGTTYPLGSLANGTYYWQIDEVNVDNVTTSCTPPLS